VEKQKAMKDRILLKKIVTEDFEGFCAMVENEKVMAMITERAMTRAEARKKFDDMLRNSGLDPLYGSFRVVEKKSTELIGFAKLEITREKMDEAELGFMLLPVFWGLGLGSEIARILLDVAKSDPRLKRVYAIIDPNNEASRKILVNNGFRSEKMGEIDGLPGEILALSV
jgi:ribosomal-protein-alanine N-acetyltransferase